MSEQSILIEPYKTYNDLVVLLGKVYIPELDIEVTIPENRSLNLYKFEPNDDLQIIPRNFESLIIKISISWKKDFQISTLANILNEYENPTEILALRLQITCAKTRWSSEQRKIELANITKRALLSFEIPMSEVKGILQIDGFITREIESKGAKVDVSDAPLAIISNCKRLTVQIDELKEIGGQYLPIGPGNTGELAFEVTGIDNPFELPGILYSEDLKEFLTRDDLLSVTSSILTCMLFFLEQYLKWLIFICRLDSSDKYYNSLIDLFAVYCGVPKDEIIDLIQMDKYSEDQVRGYLDLSNKLYRGNQLKNKYKRELKNIYKSESR